jgi:subtilisin family serine protease
VAGLVAATANNYQGIPGAGLNLVRVLPLKVFYWTTGGYGSTSDVLATAIRYAADRGAVVVNLSLGSPTPMDVVVEEAITYALSRGTLVVAASGNEGRNGLYYPAAYPGVLVVGSAKLDGTRSDFSNYSTTPADLVLAAGGNRSPAQTLWSLALGQDYPYYQSLGPYAQWAGTSFAAPQASALAGLYVAKHYTLYGRSPTPDQIRLCLTQTASNGGNYDPQTGYGLLRADRVMADTRYCFP